MAEVSVGGGVTAAQYNDLRTRLINVCSDYEITLALIETYLGTTFPAKISGDTITDDDWDKIFVVLYWLRVHQNGEADVGISTTADFAQFEAGNPIEAGDGYTYDEDGNIFPGDSVSGYNDIDETLATAQDLSGQHAANQFVTPATQGVQSDVSTPTWGGGTDDSPDGGSTGLELAGDNSRGKITREITIPFANATAKNRFFSLGGEITLYVRMTNSTGVPLTSAPSGTKANWWYNHLNVENPIDFVLSSNIFGLLSTSYQKFVEKAESNDSLYSINRTTIELKVNSAGDTITARITCSDYDRALTTWPDSPVDEDVGERVAAWIGVKSIPTQTNPLFNTSTCTPAVTAGTWATGAITGQAPLAVPPTPPGPFTFSRGSGDGTYNLGTFAVPDANWTVYVRGDTFAAGFYASGLFGSSSSAGGGNRIVIRDGSYSGTIVYDTGTLFGVATAINGRVFDGLFLKTAAGEKNYYIQYTSNGPAPDGVNVEIKCFYNGE